jgi:hypothetical protein
MTVKAFLGLRRCPKYRVIGSVALMTAGTADFVVVVRATVPRESNIGCMTFEAHTVLRLDACDRVGGETNDRFTAAAPADMQATRTVAGFTLQLPVTERAARIRRHCVLCLKYGKDYLIALMTGEAHISAHRAVRDTGIV